MAHSERLTFSRTNRLTCMQLHNTLLLLTLAFAGPLVAQPTLTLANNGPVPVGAPYAVTSYTTTLESGVYSSGVPGAGQTYGMWMIPSTGNRDMYFDAPSVTPTSASFPGVTVLSTNGGADTLFWKVNANGMEQLGLKGGTEGLAPYTNGVLELVYPCALGTTWTDAFSANLTISGFPVTRAGTVNGIADGWGTIELPGTTMENVLRVKVRKVQIDQTPLGILYRSYDSFSFYQEGIKYPVMRTSRDSLRIGAGTATFTWSADWLFGPFTVNVQDLTEQDVVFTPYPNPTNGLFDLRMESADLRSVEVINATGQVVLQKVRTQTGAIGSSLDLTGLGSGVYHVRVTQADGQQGVRRIVLQ